ncbi:MAG TPA: hypothetical protein VHK65_13365 [Candidatus Dormibacteraeota bacterium]|nr:hypothetical protein [Candidatus Dormibacteraeota bacterium]
MTDALTLWGAGAFGVVIGWFVYYINRYRSGDIQLSDIVTLIGALGGAAVLALFKPGTNLFGAYGVGLAIGFFAYFVFLLIFVAISQRKYGDFNWEWFLDGRRKEPEPPWAIPYGARPPFYRIGLAPSSAKDRGGTGEIDTTCGNSDAGLWQSVDGQDIAVRITIKNTGKCMIVGVPSDSKGLQKGLATARPGTSATVAVSSASKVEFACQGIAAAGSCTGTWTVDPIL